MSSRNDVGIHTHTDWTRGEDTCASGRRRWSSARGGRGTKKASAPAVGALVRMRWRCLES
ncbi:hypothetical protein [Haladaptatus litoreus]|uniref:hypothetical protein n=1 Tax=Haladaptatus litoreus TaxID=553468 RepID=UPI0011157C9F|nr:hypothetical protein [Haladaptatus litoreus]